MDFLNPSQIIFSKRFRVTAPYRCQHERKGEYCGIEDAKRGIVVNDVFVVMELGNNQTVALNKD